VTVANEDSRAPGPELESLVQRWTIEFGRSFGIEIFSDDAGPTGESPA
jgi:hypothetical protein